MRSFAVLLLCALVLRAEEEKPADSPPAFEFKTNPKVKLAIDKDEIVKGIAKADPRDGIPTIREPKHMTAADATWLRGGDRVLGLVVGDEARAYPLRILEGHELVNDVLGGKPVAPNY